MFLHCEDWNGGDAAPSQRSAPVRQMTIRLKVASCKLQVCCAGQKQPATCNLEPSTTPRDYGTPLPRSSCSGGWACCLWIPIRPKDRPRGGRAKHKTWGGAPAPAPPAG